MSIPVFTIGFTKSSAERFFGRLKDCGASTLVDVRLHNTSQLAGFAKADDLRYLSKAVAGVSYSHLPILAPTDGMLSKYKKDGGSWDEYEARFLMLMAERKIEERLTPAKLEGACLLCSEDTAHHCHRRLVLEYLNSRWDGVLDVRHL